MKDIVNCAAYSEGKRIADVTLGDVHNVLKEKDQFVGSAYMNHPKISCSKFKKNSVFMSLQ